MEPVEFDQTIFGVSEPETHYSRENQTHERNIPEGYMTGDEFFGKLRGNISKYYKERDLL